MKILNKKYHTLADLPHWFFKIDDEFISYIPTHVFTNFRYITIGINFPQVYNYEALEFILKNTIHIENYLLSIEKQHLTTPGITLGIFSNSIYLGEFIELECHSQKKYEELRKFLIEKWEIEDSEMEQAETTASNSELGILRFVNIILYVFVIITFIVVIMNSVTSGYLSTANLILGIVHLIGFLVLFAQSWYILSKKSNENKLVFINFRVIITWGFFVVIFLLLIFVVIFSR